MDLLARRGEDAGAGCQWWIKIDSAFSEYIEYMNSVNIFPVFFPVFLSLSLSHRCMEAGESITPEIKKVIKEEETTKEWWGLGRIR